jgi:hypothetical protein
MRFLRIRTHGKFNKVCDSMGVKRLWRGEGGYIYDINDFIDFMNKKKLDKKDEAFNVF